MVELLRKEKTMLKTIKTALAGLLIVPALVFGVALVAPVAEPVGAQSINDGIEAAKGDSGATCLFTSSTCADGIFTTIVNVLLFVIGAASVIMLIVGGIRYTVSNGDSKQVETAKNTIMYAIIGLVIAFLAYAIVNWILTSLS